MMLSWLDPDPTQKEIEDEDRIRLRHREAFRRAADYVAEAFARLTFVQRVVLFGSVAQPPRRETPRQGGIAAPEPVSGTRARTWTWPCG